MKSLLIVALGGAAGSMLRYLCQLGIKNQFPTTFPLGTFLVNVSGCFLIGLFYGIAGRYAWLNQEWRLLLITGVCGGYTTFSSYSFEAIDLLRQGNYGNFAAYVGLSVLLGLGAVFGGIALVQRGS